MARILIAGSSDGLGRMAAHLLVEEGREVVLHARDPARGRTATDAVPGAAAVLAGDLASIAQTRRLAEAASAFGTFNAVWDSAGSVDDLRAGGLCLGQGGLRVSFAGHGRAVA